MSDVAVARDESVHSWAGRARPVPAADGPSELVLRWGLRAGVAAVTVQTAAHVVYFGVLDADAGPLNVNAEESIWAWASTAVTFSAASALLLLAAVEPVGARARLLLASLLALFSLDDALQLHESYGEDFTQEVLGLREAIAHAAWPALFLPLLALALFLLVRESRRAPRPAGRLILVGCALLAAGVALEATATVLDADTWPGAIEIALEEGSELGGWILIATALAASVVSPRRAER